MQSLEEAKKGHVILPTYFYPITPTLSEFYKNNCSAKEQAIVKEILGKKSFASDSETLHKKLANAKEGAVGYTITKDEIMVNVVMGEMISVGGCKIKKRTISKDLLYVDVNHPESPYQIIQSNKKVKYFSKLNHALADIQLSRGLTSPSLSELFKSFEITINHPANPPQLKSTLLDLRSALLNKVFTQLNKGVKDSEIEIRDDVPKIIDSVNNMVNAIHIPLDQKVRLQYITACKKELCTSIAGRLGQLILSVLIAASVTLVGIALGGAIGTTIGLWSGPGAAATGIAGAAKGGAIFAKLGVAAAAAATTATFGGSSYSFWSKNTIEKTIEKTCEEAKNFSIVSPAA